MLSTFLVAAIFLGVIFAGLLCWAFLLRTGLRWSKSPVLTSSQVVRTTLIAYILQIALNLLFLLIAPSSSIQSIVLGIVELVTAIVVPCALITYIFKIPFLRALQAWLPTILASVGTLVFVQFVLRPFLYESFVVPTNSMAPTLLGQHWKGTCPECGKPNYCSPRGNSYGNIEPPLMICDAFHVTKATNIDRSIHNGDRFLVAKFLAVRRWDLIVFQHPEDPGVLYVKRLVGLPGETVHIQDGSIWIDGKCQTPPETISGNEYLSEIPGGSSADSWGSERRPALLGDDEYFVLGDFSAQAMDSRFWNQGAPGHNPFAVPQSFVKGVVTHTFWPISRWRIHRY